MTPSLIHSPADIERLLGVGFASDPDTLVQAYQKGVAEQPDRKDTLRIAWKIASDPFYKGTLQTYQSMESLVKAGFFDDRLEPGALTPLMDPHWYTTPLNKILTNLRTADQAKQQKPKLVLLTTGCFAPVHEGHLAMMEAAKARATAAGYHVVGGFFSASHDGYVATKGDRAGAYNAALRNRALQRSVLASDWLAADLWESAYTPMPVNFTDVIVRMQDYLDTHLQDSVQLAYVYGSDNAGFSAAFCQHGVGIVVSRPGYEDRIEAVRRDPRMQNKSVLFTDPLQDAQKTPRLSSTDVRRGLVAPLAAAETEMATHAISSDIVARQQTGQTVSNNYLIRDDLTWATQSWQQVCDAHILEKANQWFVTELSHIIQHAFEHSHLMGAWPKHPTIKVLFSGVQEAIIQDMSAHRPVLNLDVVTADHGVALGVSRKFGLADAQFYSRDLIERPGCEGRLAGLSTLNPGQDYILVDDDIATGTTMTAVEQRLPDGVQVASRVSLSELAFKQQYGDTADYSFWDIVDARDFLIGAKAGGLVVELPNQHIARAPYLLPYVTLANRAKIPPDQELILSQQILELNKTYYAMLNNKISLKETDPAFQDLMTEVGFSDPDVTLDKIIAWHADKMTCLPS